MDQGSRGYPPRRGAKGYYPWPRRILGGLYPSRGLLFYTNSLNYRNSITFLIRTPAQVLGVYHAFVFTTHPASRYRSVERMEFLWVRWLGMEPRYRSGPRYARLPIVGFVEDSDELAFGFLDPSLVIRGSHLVPRFSLGRTNTLMSYRGPTAARTPGCTDDWTNFYVNMYAAFSSQLSGVSLS